MSDLQVVDFDPKSTLILTDNSLISVVAKSQVNEIWDEFLRLQISNETKRTYACDR